MPASDGMRAISAVPALVTINAQRALRPFVVARLCRISLWLLEQHGAQRGLAIGCHAGNAHRVGIKHLRFHGLGKSVLELPKGVRIERTVIQSTGAVVAAEIGDINAHVFILIDIMHL